MKKLWRLLFVIPLVALLVYGGIRLYFRITDGFVVSNITSDFSYDPRWDTRLLSSEAWEEISKILDQKFSYLGKGCQSYVFESEDGKYVLKFFKYQRYRKSLIDRLSFIPWIKNMRIRRLEHKRKKLEKLFSSWKIAFDHLSNESEILFVHLNKTQNLNKKLTFTDKIGQAHTVDLDQMEFMLQKKATMICPKLDALMHSGNVEEAKEVLHKTIGLILSEYERGYADNDHALMQNTGVVDGKPIHVDIGQFVIDESIKDEYSQHLVNKMHKFGLWLDNNYPELGKELDREMEEILGEKYTILSYQQPIR